MAEFHRSLRHHLCCLLCSGVLLASGSAAGFDVILANGRVMDPESGLDAVRYVGIEDGRITAISETPLEGNNIVDVAGLVVAPGFIDLHSHANSPDSDPYRAHDGVTTELELELGEMPVDGWYRRQAGRRLIHYGAAVSHMTARAAAIFGTELLKAPENPIAAGLITLEDYRAATNTALTAEQTRSLLDIMQQGLDEGALGIGMAIQYLKGVSREEVYRSFQTATKNDVALFVHSRSAGLLPPTSVDALQELLANAVATGAALHIVHIGSSGLTQVPLMIEMIDSARRQGLDVTTEVYPYRGGMAVFANPLLTGNWRERFGIDYSDIQHVRTGNRLTKETFERGVRETPEDAIVVHMTPQTSVDFAVRHPDVMIASDAVEVGPGRGHPRTAGTYSRVLGRYVRERDALTLMQALKKMTLMPAQRLEAAVQQMARKGRIQVGADADITVFNPATVIDMATYEQNAQFSEGIEHVLVAGTFVVRDGATVEGVFPGEPVRRDVSGESTVVADAVSVEEFADAAMDELMQVALAPGAIVTIVKNDDLLLAKGYGMADVESGRAPDPNTTLFHIASIGKLMTASSALRLYERGQIDLDTDINEYLTSVHAPLIGGAPVTARLLMTHRAGFETQAYHQVVPLEHGEAQTREEMQRELARIRPPSSQSIYDNVGFGLLGQLAADVKGTSFAEVVREEIFEPLDMRRSVAGFLPQHRLADSASCYTRAADGSAKKCPLVGGVQIGQGAGDIHVTAVDMAKFMGAMLMPGNLLKASTFNEMMNFDNARIHSELPGLGFAMMEREYGGRPAAGHRGQIDGFISKLALFPDSGLGVFVSVNATNGPVMPPRLSSLWRDLPDPPAESARLAPDPMIDEFMTRFARQFVPHAPRQPSHLTVVTQLSAEQLAGVYARPDASQFAFAQMQSVAYGRKWQARGSDVLVSEFCSPFQEVSPMYYECAREGESPLGIGFLADGEDLWAAIASPGTIKRLPWWRTAPLALWPLPIAVLIGMSVFIRPWSAAPAQLARSMFVTGWATIAFLVALLLELEFAYPLSHSGAAALPVLWRLVFLLAAASLLFNAVTGARFVINGHQTAGMSHVARIHAGIVVLAAIVIVWLSHVWGLFSILR